MVVHRQVAVQVKGVRLLVEAAHQAVARGLLRIQTHQPDPPTRPTNGLSSQHSLGLNTPLYDSEYPGYLRVRHLSYKRVLIRG